MSKVRTENDVIHSSIFLCVEFKATLFSVGENFSLMCVIKLDNLLEAVELKAYYVIWVGNRCEFV